MPFLMHIAIDNSARVSRRVSYFEYRDVRFKLIQNDPRKYSDVLVTIVERHDSAVEQRAYGAAGEWLSALAWKTRARTAIHDAGGMGIRPRFTLRQSRCRVFAFPEVTPTPGTFGHDIVIIPHVETEQQRVALTLFREAASANKVWLAFLFYWQVLEVGQPDPVGWINRAYYSKGGVYLRGDQLQGLPLRGRRLGEYLQEEGRHAIAHVRRKPGRRALRFDDKAENRRMNVAADVMEKFAAHYIREELRVVRSLHLMRRRGKGFPVYIDDQTLRKGGWTRAYG